MLFCLRVLIKFAEPTSPDGGAGGHASLNLGVTFLPSGAHRSCRSRPLHAGKRIRYGFALLQNFLHGIVVFALVGQIGYGGNLLGEGFTVLGLVCVAQYI